MMTAWLVVWTLWSGTWASAGEVERFYGHLTTPARTLEPGQVAFETFPGANAGTLFLINSLSVGVTPWLQVGAVPFFYLLHQPHRFNGNIKVNFVRERYLQVGAGYSHFSFRLSDQPFIVERDSSVTTGPRADLGFAFIALSYRDPGSLWAYGLNMAFVEAWSNSRLIQDYLRERVKRRREWGLDVSYDVNACWVVTAGINEQSFDLFEITSPFAFGLGLSVTRLYQGTWLSRLRLGANYTPSLESVRGLFSIEF